MTDPNTVPFAWRALLAAAFHRCAAAGYGRVEQRPDGSSHFTAHPGQEDAAANYIQTLLAPRCAR
jgi:hypothetical protein